MTLLRPHNAKSVPDRVDCAWGALGCEKTRRNPAVDQRCSFLCFYVSTLGFAHGVDFPGEPY